MQKKLIIAGSILILIGLILGTALDWFANSDIASDAHVAGVQHGMLLVLVALAWKYSRLGRLELICAFSITTGLFGIFAAFLAGAIIGEPYPAASIGTNILFVFASWVLITGFVIYIYGLFRNQEGKDSAHGS